MSILSWGRKREKKMMINGKQTKNKQSNVYTSEQRNRWTDKNKDMREWKIFIET